MTGKFNFADGIFLAAAALLFALRIWVGRIMGVFIFAASPHDDVLMFQYADLAAHFAKNLPENFLLIKDMGFPVFLKIVELSGVQYVDAISFLWLIAAALTAGLFALVTDVKDRRILLAVFAFVLFSPVAFTGIGRRIYRQGFLSPLYFLTLEMMAILFVCCWKKIKIPVKLLAVFSAIFGGVFTLTFYVKEDGAWLMMCLAATVLLCFVRNIFSVDDLRTKFLRAGAIILPLIIFFAGTNFYKAVNEKFFGVYEINARTEGELGRFLKNVYRVESAERTGKIWAPAAALKKIFDASETLRGAENLRYRVFHTDWFGGDIFKNPVRGDFLGWVMTTELYNSGAVHTLAEQEKFLKKVNGELDAAFENGTLQKDSKFQLVSSMGGRSLKEIFDLRRLIGKIYLAHVTTRWYDLALEVPGQVHYPKNDAAAKEKYRAEIESISAVINMNLLAEDTDFERRQIVARVIFCIYMLINSALFIAALVALFKTFKFKENRLEIFIMAAVFLLALIYALAVSWFAEFINYQAALFYSNGIVPMLTIFEIFGAHLFITNFKRIKG